MPSDHDLVHAALAGPLAPISEQVRELILPSYRIDAAEETTRSRIGGRADLPPGTQWPADVEGRPLDFLAQIDTTELPGRGPLPDGLLVFFYDAEHQPWGFEQAHGPGHAVLLVPPGTETTPTGEPGPYTPRHITFTEELTLPEFDAPGREDIDSEALDALADALAVQHLADLDGVPIHRVLGHPESPQGDMRERCRDMVGGDEWCLLLQLESEFEPHEVMWGDAGRIYFWARVEELRAGRIGPTWLFLQC